MYGFGRWLSNLAGRPFNKLERPVRHWLHFMFIPYFLFGVITWTTMVMFKNSNCWTGTGSHRNSRSSNQTKPLNSTPIWTCRKPLGGHCPYHQVVIVAITSRCDRIDSQTKRINAGLDFTWIDPFCDIRDVPYGTKSIQIIMIQSSYITPT